MRILQVTNKFPYPAKDGGAIATLALSKSFAACGNEVTILAMNTSKHFTDTTSLPAELTSKIRFIGVQVNTDIRFLQLALNYFFSTTPYNAQRFISRDFSKALHELLSKEVFDLIQLEGLYLSPYLALIRSLTDAPVVMRAHNIEHEIWQRTACQSGGIKKIYLRNLASRIKSMEVGFLNRYDAMLPITARDGSILQELGCSIPMHTVPMGVDTAELIPDHETMAFPSVFHIGALDWMPNQEGLLWFFRNVWDKVLQRHPDVIFYLAGRNAPEEFRNLPFRNVKYCGEVADSHEFMRSYGVMVVPVLSGSGMRIKIIEGMALSKGIVTTSTGTEGISTTHEEDLLIADEPDDFAACVCKLIEDRGFYSKLGENARNFVAKNYDHLAICKSLLDFYRTLRP